MKILIYRNTSSRRWGHWNYRGRVRGWWIGPVYVTTIRSAR